MPYANSGLCRIYYESHGSGPTVALVHGAGGNHAVWWQQVARLRERYRVLTIDLRGFGLSEVVPGGPDALDFHEDIRAVLLHAEAPKAAILGQSLGGAAAFRLAVRYPQMVAAVLLTNSVGNLDDADLTAIIGADRKEALKRTVIDRLMTKEFQTKHPDRTFLFQQVGTFNRAKLEDIHNVNAPGPKPEQVIASGVPIYFIAAELDWVSQEAAQLAHRLLPGSVLTIAPGAPHSMYWEAPDRFNALLERYLDDVFNAQRD